MHDATGWWWFGGVTLLLLVAALVVGGVLLARWSARQPTAPGGSVPGGTPPGGSFGAAPAGAEQAEAVLRHRYATGELDDEEFQRRLGVLRQR